MAEFFLFSGLMYLTTVIFAIMSMFYVYVTPRDVIEKSIDDSSSSSDLGSHRDDKLGKENKALELEDGLDGIKVATPGGKAGDHSPDGLRDRSRSNTNEKRKSDVQQSTPRREHSSSSESEDGTSM